MKKVFFLIIILASFSMSGIYAQTNGSSYNTALGVKFYPGAGITIKHFIKDNVALEGIGYFWKDGMRITGLYEFHGDINGAAGLKWYAGLGAHISVWNENWRKRYPERTNASAVGVDGVLGLDYKFKGAPINMSIDWQPSVDFGRYYAFNGNWGGFSIRYTFN